MSKKGGLFNKWYWNNWISICQKMNFDRDFLPYEKINSKWIIDLNTKSKTLKHLVKNIVENLSDPGLDKNFLDTTPKA